MIVLEWSKNILRNKWMCCLFDDVITVMVLLGFNYSIGVCSFGDIPVELLSYLRLFNRLGEAPKKAFRNWVFSGTFWLDEKCVIICAPNDIGCLRAFPAWMCSIEQNWNYLLGWIIQQQKKKCNEISFKLSTRNRQL